MLRIPQTLPYLRAMELEEESSPASLGQTNISSSLNFGIVHHDDQMHDLPELLTAR